MVEAPAALAALRGLPMLSELGIIDGAQFGAVPAFAADPMAETRYYRFWQVLACEAWLQGHC